MKPFLLIVLHVSSVVLAVVLAGFSILLSGSGIVHGGLPCTSSLVSTPCGKKYPIQQECEGEYYIDKANAAEYTTRQATGMNFTFPCAALNCDHLQLKNYPPESGSCTRHPRTSVE